MTVCIAAIFSNNSVLGASDRMLTAGESIEFEPNQPKIWPLTTSIAVMVAGDILIHSELHRDVGRIVAERISKEPQNWWRVEDVAELYSQSYVQLRKKRASREILEPFGLDFESFISKQKSELSPEFIKRIEYKLDEYQIGGASAIIAGIDTYGAHIFTIENERVSCNNPIGFSVIGIGARHASPHFMLAGHTQFNSGPRTLLITHQAKRRSEVAPGVGKGTDMFMIGPQLGSFNQVNETWIKELDKIYDSTLKKTETLNKKAEGSVEKFLQEQAEKEKQKQEPKVEPTHEKLPTETGG